MYLITRFLNRHSAPH